MNPQPAEPLKIRRVRKASAQLLEERPEGVQLEGLDRGQPRVEVEVRNGEVKREEWAMKGEGANEGIGPVDGGVVVGVGPVAEHHSEGEVLEGCATAQCAWRSCAWCARRGY